MQNWTEHNVTVLGSGESGMGAALLATAKGFMVMISDAGPISREKKAQLFAAHVRYEENGHDFERIRKSDLVIKSPGIPNEASIIQQLHKAKVPVISEIEFASRYCQSKVIGITGSNGKTTTTLLTHHLLKSGGVHAELAGNIGTSFSKLMSEQQPEVVVLELSSFQLEDVNEFKADVAMLLNITPDHLDRYDYDMEQYADAKMNLLNRQTDNDLVIYNQDDEIITRKLNDASPASQRIGFSVMGQSQGAIYLEGDQIVFNVGGLRDYIKLTDLPLMGRHNVYNAMAAISAALHHGVHLKDILSGLKSFKNAPHRMEFVDKIEGVTFINDSKATNVDSVYYALDAMEEPVIWIAGGINKGNDYDQIKDLVSEKVKALICIGLDNDHLIDAFGNVVEHVEETDAMIRAVETAFDQAEPGQTVLLSPACSSFDLFENYEDRGNVFKEKVRLLKKKISDKALTI